jgi:hypothetical protein
MLGALTSYRLFHTHLTVDLARELFDFDSQPFQRLVDDLRVFAAAAESDLPGLIVTFVYGGPDEGFIRQTIGVMETAGAEVALSNWSAHPKSCCVTWRTRRVSHTLVSREQLAALLESRD